MARSAVKRCFRKRLATVPAALVCNHPPQRWWAQHWRSSAVPQPLASCPPLVPNDSLQAPSPCRQKLEVFFIKINLITALWFARRSSCLCKNRRLLCKHARWGECILRFGKCTFVLDDVSTEKKNIIRHAILIYGSVSVCWSAERVSAEELPC